MVCNGESKRKHSLRAGRASPPLHRRWSRLSGRGGHHRAGGAQRGHYWSGGQPAGELPDVDRLRGPADQWNEHGSTSGPARADRGRARAHYGHLWGLHRGLHHGLGEGRTAPNGEPDRGFVAVSVCVGRPAFAAAPDYHAGRRWHGDHAHRRHGHADRVRLAGGCARRHAVGRSPGRSRSDARYAGGVGPVRPSDLATVGAAHQHRGGLRGGRSLRTIRHSARNRSALDRLSH